MARTNCTNTVYIHITSPNFCSRKITSPSSDFWSRPWMPDVSDVLHTRTVFLSGCSAARHYKTSPRIQLHQANRSALSIILWDRTMPCRQAVERMTKFPCWSLNSEDMLTRQALEGCSQVQDVPQWGPLRENHRNSAISSTGFSHDGRSRCRRTAWGSSVASKTAIDLHIYMYVRARSTVENLKSKPALWEPHHCCPLPCSAPFMANSVYRCADSDGMIRRTWLPAACGSVLKALGGPTGPKSHWDVSDFHSLPINGGVNFGTRASDHLLRPSHLVFEMFVGCSSNTLK